MPIVYFIRHGEAEHNFHKTSDFDPFNIRDAPLTEEGNLQSRNLSREMTKLGVAFDHILVSPQARALRTCEQAFFQQYFFQTTKARVLPELQESGDSPSSTPLSYPTCRDDTGLQLVRLLGLYDWSRLENESNNDWHQKKGLYRCERRKLCERATFIKSYLAELDGTVAIVAHDNIMRRILDPALSPSTSTDSLQTKRFSHCGWRKYSLDHGHFREIDDQVERSNEFKRKFEAMCARNLRDNKIEGTFYGKCLKSRILMAKTAEHVKDENIEPSPVMSKI